MSLPPRVRSIIAQVAQERGVTVDDLVGPSTRRKFSEPRHEAMAWVRATVEIAGAPASFPLIGRWFGGRHWTTVIHACEKYPDIGTLPLGMAA